MNGANILSILQETISPGREKHGGIKPTLTLWPLEAHSNITILHACALTFSNPSLKVACSYVCGPRRLCRSSRLSERISPLHRVTYKVIVIKEAYLLLLSPAPLCSTGCMENINLSQTQVHLHSTRWKAFWVQLVHGIPEKETYRLALRGEHSGTTESWNNRLS